MWLKQVMWTVNFDIFAWIQKTGLWLSQVTNFVHFQWWCTTRTKAPVLYSFMNTINLNKFADESLNKNRSQCGKTLDGHYTWLNMYMIGENSIWTFREFNRNQQTKSCPWIPSRHQECRAHNSLVQVLSSVYLITYRIDCTLTVFAWVGSCLLSSFEKKRLWKDYVTYSPLSGFKYQHLYFERTSFQLLGAQKC